MAVTNQKSRPGSDNSHDAPGCANQFGLRHNFKQSERDHTGGRSDPGDQICKPEARGTDRALERRPEHIESEQVEEEMSHIVVKKKRREQPPKFAFANNSGVIEGAESPHDDLRIQSSSVPFDIKDNQVNEDEQKDDRRLPDARIKTGFPGLSRRCGGVVMPAGGEHAKNFELFTDLRGGMQPLKKRGQSPGGSVSPVIGELRSFAQAHGRQKQKNEPRAAATIAGH